MKRVNITILTYGRPRLLRQALRTLEENTDSRRYRLTMFNDEMRLGTGGARNQVIKNADFEGREDYLYLSDLDVAFTHGWLDTLIEAYEFARAYLQVGALGGYCHPYHQPYERHSFKDGRDIGITWTLPTQSMLMTWDIFDKFGPFDQTSPGKVQQGEDWLFTERLRAAGLRCASLYPPVVYNTARHDSFGKPMVGHELVQDIEGLIIE